MHIVSCIIPAVSAAFD